MRDLSVFHNELYFRVDPFLPFRLFAEFAGEHDWTGYQQGSRTSGGGSSHGKTKTLIRMAPPGGATHILEHLALMQISSPAHENQPVNS